MALAFVLKTAIMLSIFICVFFFPSMVLSNAIFSKITLPPTATGPESIAFKLSGAFYTGVADGRILKYQPITGFEDFAYTAATRAECDGTTDLNMGPKCGRPFGLGLNLRTNQLYICDAFLGLFVADRNGRLATLLASGAEGQAFKFCNGLDVDQTTGIVYFTDASLIYDLRQAAIALQVGDSTGRLLKYDPNTTQVTVLLRNLAGPAGTAVSSDSKYVLVSEFIANRTKRLWLTGDRAFTTDTIDFQPRPNNIKRTGIKSFWEAALLPEQPAQITVPIGQRFNEIGRVLQRGLQVNLEEYYNTTAVSEVQEFAGALYISSRFVNYIGVLKNYI